MQIFDVIGNPWKKILEILFNYCVIILWGILLGTKEIVTILIQVTARSMDPFPKDTCVLQHGKIVTSENFLFESSFLFRKWTCLLFYDSVEEQGFSSS